MKAKMKRGRPFLLARLAVFACLYLVTQATHFRGGTISWKSEGGRKVLFLFKLGWEYGVGSHCTETNIGQRMGGPFKHYWQCLKGCPSQKSLNGVGFYCNAASQKQNWQQGQDTFTYTFQSDGPFAVGYTMKKRTWVQLSHKNDTGPWYLSTTVDLRVRNDTGEVNSSPLSLSKPQYRVQFGCENQMTIPAIDPDGDGIRCRWAIGNEECGSICGGLPGAELDEETCTLRFNTSTEAGYVPSGTYAVALMIEDYSSTAPGEAMSSVPLQFLVTTMPAPTPQECFIPLRFLEPTPGEMERIVVVEGHTLKLVISAENGANTTGEADDIHVSGPLSLKKSPVTPDVNRTNAFLTTLTWKTSTLDRGDHVVCASLENADGVSMNQRCFTVQVVSSECSSLPCINHGKCVPVNSTAQYFCNCRPGYTGPHCEHAIPVTTTTTTQKRTRTAGISLGNTPTDNNTTKASKEASTTSTRPISEAPEPTPKGTCGVETYENCWCRSGQAAGLREVKVKDGWSELVGGIPRRTRDALSFVFGLPLGLALSVLTSTVYNWFQQRRERKTSGDHRSPRPKPQWPEQWEDPYDGEPSTSQVERKEENPLTRAQSPF